SATAYTPRGESKGSKGGKMGAPGGSPSQQSAEVSRGTVYTEKRRTATRCFQAPLCLPKSLCLLLTASFGKAAGRIAKAQPGPFFLPVLKFGAFTCQDYSRSIGFGGILEG